MARVINSQGCRSPSTSTIGSPSLAASLANSSCVIRSRQAWAMSDSEPADGLDPLLAQNVAHADPQLLGVFEAVQDRIDVLRPPRHSSVSVASRNARSGKRLRTRPSINSSSMPGLLVKMPDRYWLDEQSCDIQPAAWAG